MSAALHRGGHRSGSRLTLAAEELGERVVQLLNRRLDHDVTEVFGDADVALENALDHA